jgi:shikimate dehydrogenase
VKHDQYDVVINATSLSMNGEVPDISNHIYEETTCIYDMVYRKEPTAFLKHAHQQGSRNVSDGLGMLVGQAAKSFELWTGQVVNTTPVLEKLRKQIQG